MEVLRFADADLSGRGSSRRGFGCSPGAVAMARLCNLAEAPGATPRPAAPWETTPECVRCSGNGPVDLRLSGMGKFYSAHEPSTRAVGAARRRIVNVS